MQSERREIVPVDRFPIDLSYINWFKLHAKTKEEVKYSIPAEVTIKLNRKSFDFPYFPYDSK